MEYCVHIYCLFALIMEVATGTLVILHVLHMEVGIHKNSAGRMKTFGESHAGRRP